MTPKLFIVEDLIRKGRMRDAQEIIRDVAVNYGPLSPALVLKIAAYARRANLAELALKLLSPLVEQKDEAVTAEYAANLVRVGATREALHLLGRINAKAFPQAHLFTAFALIGEWRYAEAVSPLQSYLATVPADSYAGLVARTNLASCWVFTGERESALAELKSLRDETRRFGFQLLHGIAWKMTAQTLIEGTDVSAARRALGQAERALLRVGALDRVFLRKWTVFLDLKTDGPTPEVLARLATLRGQAARQGHWETVRDCDRHLLVAKPSEALYHRLYFGTPFESFRRQLTESMRGIFTLPDSYVWCLGRALSPARAPLFGDMQAGDTSHRLLLALCSDFYRSFRTASLFVQVFPGERFNPHSSPIRIRMALTRLRRHLRKSGVALGIEANEGEYRIDPRSEVCLRLEAPQCGLDKSAVQLSELKKVAGTAEFRARDLAEHFSCSARTIQRLLADALERDQVVRLGGSRDIRYAFR